MTRLLEPYRVEHTIRVTNASRSLTIPGAWILAAEPDNWYVRDIPFSVLKMLKAHGTIDVKIRRLENTQFIEAILSIQKAG